MNTFHPGPSSALDKAVHIPVFERTKKQIFYEKVYGKTFLSLLYPSHSWMRRIVWPALQLLCRFPFISALYGWLQNRPGSKKKIAPFIHTFGVDASEFEKEDFSSFNDFFVRHLKPSARPLGQGIVAPADGRYRFIPNIQVADTFYVKGQQFDLKTFLQDRELAHTFAKGSLVIARLAPPDYHRYHYPAGGVASMPRFIPGPLFSVNPLALRQRLSYLTSNKRFITEISGEYGRMLFVEIGATNVGSIHHTGLLEGPVKKGAEKGYFAFGASAIALLFEPGRIQFEDDLLRAPKECEIRCLVGQTIATLKETW